MALISCQNLHVALGGRTLLHEATLQIERGERIGLLGRNGEGKSTLLNVINGSILPDDGKIVRDSGVKIALLEQQVPEGQPKPVMEVIREGFTNGSGPDHEIDRLCSLMELDPAQSFDSLSGGQKRRTLLAKALASDPDLLLLDEPTNHLDIESIEWLEKFLIRFSGSLLFITHDREFLQKLATRIIELDRGNLTSWACDYPTYQIRKEEWLAAEEKQWAQFDKKLAQEEVWIRQGIKARRTRNEGRVRALEKLRRERSKRVERVGKVNMSIQSAERSGTKVIKAQELSFTYPGESQPTLENFSTEIMRGDRIGIIGPNGCGKSTLINVLLGKLQPQAGSIETGTNLEIAYFDQHRDQLDGNKTLIESVGSGSETILIDGARKHIVSYLQDFLFSPDRIRQPVRCLSGGERNRLLLARLFTKASNVLILDEPTNDLDTETLELLETRLSEYPGTVLIVSHDRRFLDNLCTSSFVFEGPSQINEYVGGYSDWQNEVKRRTKAVEKQNNSPLSSKPAAAKKKLSNKEREAWKTLPKTIETLEAELESLGEQMAQPDFYSKTPEQIQAATERSQAIPGEIDAAFEQWAELDERA